ncbi:LigA [Rhodotorula toruloides ATCC 204091]|uniref:BY PROTMAP: gi/342319167/gb/EGU11117.1/ LigA [Rhodotorula glutinis ATCC 204091] n=1 Tax=Rhodotorula toruloides TaxID=5286 RepID=A0A0K3CQV3_RHOTO|nr:LigA [Rhodotorula toruloides ATCC 204091]KAK4329694.1 LigA [Rhodotorula toruloides]PRQ72287.1 hypothetical protein AAT19DRAFT_9626 [Rhodotorula toruloides]
MQAALAALSSSSSSRANAGRGASPAVVGGQGGGLPDLDPLRLRLVQLIDAVTGLHSQLSYLAFSAPTPSTANPGILPFPELVARYNLLLTHLSALQGLLSSEGDKERERERERQEGMQGGAAGRKRRAERDRDVKRERWESVSVVPAEKVDEAKDWLVGMLLRTKQTPDVEASQASTIASLPEPFASALTATTASSSSATPLQPAQAPTATSFDSLVADHARVLSLAHDKILALKEFNSDNEQWDWKARVDLEEDEDGEEGGGEKMQVDAGAGEGKRAWTAQEVQAYLRAGKRPDL